MQKMEAARLFLDWQPREDFEPGLRDIAGKRAQEGNRAWRNPRVKIVKQSLPKIGPTEVLIKVRACGICGSDILMAAADQDGFTRYGYIMRDGVVIGHEFSGEIVVMGKRIEELQRKTGKHIFKAGTPVTAQCVINCGLCEKCKEGKFDECLLNEERGFSVDGAMAEYLAADIRHIYSLEELKGLYAGWNLFLAGALVEPLAGAYKAIVETAGGIKPGDNAVVIGGGPIGLSAAALLKAMGAARVILFEPSHSRRTLGREMGADFAFDPEEVDFKETILDLTHGVGAKVYFEAAGVFSKIWPDVDYLLKKGEPGSKFILFGHGPGEMKVFPETLIGGYNVLVGSHGHTACWRNVIRMVGAGLVDPRKMATKTIALTEAPKWLEILQSNKEEGKVMIAF